jgi:hypothetical protein
VKTPEGVDDEDVLEKTKERTDGHGPDSRIDAVGMEAHGDSLMAVYDSVRTDLRMETDRPTALRRFSTADEKVVRRMSKSPHGHRANGQYERVPDPVSHGCSRASGGKAAEKSYIDVPDQHETDCGTPKDDIRRAEESGCVEENKHGR